MKIDIRNTLSISAVPGMLAFTSPMAAQRPQVEALLTRDVKGAADNPLTGRYEGSVLFAQTTKAFDEITLPSGPAQGNKFRRAEQKFAATVTAQGRVTRSVYIAPAGRSSLEVTAQLRRRADRQGFHAGVPMRRRCVRGKL